MKRILYQKMVEWKHDSRRKPLLVEGARQVGKTWLINLFGHQEYKRFVYLNFEKNPDLKSLFTSNLSPLRIINNIGLLFGIKIEAKNTLICFDEIQVCPRALTSLKYFQEQTPQFHIIGAGSLLGVSLGKTTSFPVGTVNFLTLYPLCFREYLMAIGEELLVDHILESIGNESFLKVIHDKLITHLKMYFFLGGMPEVVDDYIKNKDIVVARKIQKDILKSYKNDFSKYSSANQAIKLSEVWQSLPYQLAKENKKFKYSDVKKKARASSYDSTIEWLKNAGLIHVVNQLRTPKLPLPGYADLSKFKIYMLDTGLLGAMLELTSDIILDPIALFKQYNGAFVENYVCVELIKTLETKMYYWTSDRSAEVNFVFQKNNQIIPLEVKSGTNRSMKSLRVYEDKYRPKHLIRTSPRNFEHRDNFSNLPLYTMLGFKKLLDRFEDF